MTSLVAFTVQQNMPSAKCLAALIKKSRLQYPYAQDLCKCLRSAISAVIVPSSCRSLSWVVYTGTNWPFGKHFYVREVLCRVRKTFCRSKQFLRVDADELSWRPANGQSSKKVKSHATMNKGILHLGRRVQYFMYQSAKKMRGGG